MHGYLFTAASLLQEREEPRVDLASLKLQGMAAHSQPAEGQLASASRTKTQRQSVGGGHIGRPGLKPRQMQLRKHRSVRSIAIHGAAIDSHSEG